MHVHIHNRFSAHENRFFRAELDEIDAEIAIQTGGPDLAYKTHWERIRGWGRLLRSAWRKSRASLRSQPAPDAVFVQTHIQLIVLVIRRRLARARRRSDGERAPVVGLVSFIVAQNERRLSSWLRRVYYGRVLSVTDLAFCHAQSDLSRYQSWYPRHAAKLRFQPFGYAVDPHGSPDEATPDVPAGRYVFAAGRSSRDYSTLIEAVRSAEYPVFIACDSAAELPEGELPPHVTILRSCYGRSFRAMVANAALLVTPLEPVEHSAGQMVVLEGLAVGIPQVVTEIPGIIDYVDDGRAAALVPPRDPGALGRAIDDLLADDEMRERLTHHGRAFFEAHLTRQRSWIAMVSEARALIAGDHERPSLAEMERNVVLEPAPRPGKQPAAKPASRTSKAKAPGPPRERTGQRPDTGSSR